MGDERAISLHFEGWTTTKHAATCFFPFEPPRVMPVRSPIDGCATRDHSCSHGGNTDRRHVHMRGDSTAAGRKVSDFRVSRGGKSVPGFSDRTFADIAQLRDSAANARNGYAAG